MNLGTDTNGSSTPALRHILVLRGVDGAGGGADKIILRNAQQIDRTQFRMSLVFLRHESDQAFDFDRRAERDQLEYYEVRHRGALDLTVWTKLHALAARLQPDLIHSHEYKSNYFALHLSRRLHVPVVSTAHGWTGHNWRERWLYYPADKRQLRHADHVIAVSSQIRHELLRHGIRADRCDVLLNGVDPRRYQLNSAARERVRREWGWDETSFVIGAVGRVEPQKRFDILLQAFARFAARHAQARLVIVGEGSQLAELRRQVAQLNLADRVQVPGHQGNMLSMYQAFDLFVQSSDYEGTPTVVVEAMAMQIPIVATDVGGTSELLRHEEHGLLVPPRDPQRLVAAMEQTCGDAAATQRRVQAARARVENELNFARRLDRLTAIYRAVLSRQPAS